MLDQSFETPIVLIACGLGLAVAGAGRALFPMWRRKAMIAPASAVAALGVAGLGSLGAVGEVALIVAGFATFLLVIRSRWFLAAIRSCTVIARQPVVVASVMCVCGIALAALGAMGVDRAVQFAEFKEFTFFQVMTTMPPVAPEPTSLAQSDCGSPIRLLIPTEAREPDQLREIEHSVLENLNWNDNVIRRQPAADDCNCHGWVFTGGQFWLRAEEVECILDDNSYQPVSEPRPGDLTVYRNPAGGIAHTAVVRAVCDDGVPIVEGKWGWMGVFLHRAGDSCYGQDYTFYRSERDGHRLVGLPGAQSPAAPVIRTD